MMDCNIKCVIVLTTKKNVLLQMGANFRLKNEDYNINSTVIVCYS